MKKFLVLVAALACVFAFGMNAYADNVETTLTSATVTGVEGGCEQAGSVQFTFPENIVLQEGEYWYADLKFGSKLCKDIDYVIGARVATLAPTNSDYVLVKTSGEEEFAYFQGDTALDGQYSAGTNGPVTTKKVDNSATTTYGFEAVGNVGLRVKGDADSNRVTVYVVGDGMGTTGSITVSDGWELLVKLFDGKAHNISTRTGASDTVIMIDIDKTMYDVTTLGTSTPAVATTDSGTSYYSFGSVYGSGTAAGTDIYANLTATTPYEYINYGAASGTTGTYDVPHVENALCLNFDDFSGVAEFFSYYYKDSEHTFTGDSEIAHMGTGNNIDLLACTNTGSKGEIGSPQLLTTTFTQNNCIFDYETPTNYCSTWAGSRIYLDADTDSATNTFGEQGNKYSLYMATVTTGAYWSSAGVNLYGAKTNQDICTTAISSLSTTGLTSVNWLAFLSTAATTMVTSFDAGTCAVPDSKKATVLAAPFGDITSLDDYTDLMIDFPAIVFDSEIATDGTEVTVMVELDKYPCGMIFLDTFTIGTFTTVCSSSGDSAGSTTLLFPALTGSDAAANGWWNQYVIANGSNTEGTVTLTFVDLDGNKATWTSTDKVPAGGHMVIKVTQDDLTQVTGTFDFAANYTVVATCNFSRSGGLVMLGDSTQGVGYTAYSTGW